MTDTSQAARPAAEPARDHIRPIAMPDALKGTTRLALNDLMALGAAIPALDLMRAVSVAAEPDDLAGTRQMQAVLEAALADYRYGPRSG